MKGLNDYSISFKGLKEGMHEFDYNIDSTFFEQFEESEITNGNLTVKIELEKRTQFLNFTFEIEGTVVVPCDRCLDDVELPIEYEGKLYVKFGEEEEEQTDEVWIIPFEEHQVNVARYIYESIVLSLPYQRSHDEDEDGNSLCNPEMLQKLNEHLVEEDDKIDPRWADLKKLMDNNNN